MVFIELAKKLKDAGFPQSEFPRVQQQTVRYARMPTLSTLIEACGEGFGALGKEPDRWVACEYVFDRGE